MPEDTRRCTGNTTDHCQYNATTMQPADTLLGFHMGNTPLVFQNGKYHSGFPQGKCTHGFLPDKPSRRHNGLQNTSTVSEGINPFPTLRPPSQPLQCHQNESQRIMSLVFFVFWENFIHPYLHETAQSHVTILFCYQRFFSFSEFKRIQKK